MTDKSKSKFANISSQDAAYKKTLKICKSCDRDGRFEFHNTYELKKVSDDFLMDFPFFTH